MFLQSTNWWVRLTLVSYFAVCSLVGTGWHSLLGCYHPHGEAVCHAHDAEADCPDHDGESAPHFAPATAGTDADDCPICRFQSQAKVAIALWKPELADRTSDPLFSLYALPSVRDGLGIYCARAPPTAA